LSNQAKTFLILNGEFYTYQDLKNRIEYYIQLLAHHNLVARDVVLLSGKLDLNFFALMLSLIQKSTVVIPVSSSLEKSILSKYTNIAQTDYLIYVQDDGQL
jgi:acyl-coenzyme A synthetase/AMP-(fatty) acid ligase